MCTMQLSSYEINRDQWSLAGNADCWGKEDNVPALAQLMRSSKGGGGVMNEEAPKTPSLSKTRVFNVHLTLAAARDLTQPLL